jgi:hypothetical protein
MLLLMLLLVMVVVAAVVVLLLSVVLVMLVFVLISSTVHTTLPIYRPLPATTRPHTPMRHALVGSRQRQHS